MLRVKNKIFKFNRMFTEDDFGAGYLVLPTSCTQHPPPMHPFIQAFDLFVRHKQYLKVYYVEITPPPLYTHIILFEDNIILTPPPSTPVTRKCMNYGHWYLFFNDIVPKIVFNVLMVNIYNFFSQYVPFVSHTSFQKVDRYS